MGILEIQHCEERIVVGGNGIFVLSETGDVTRDCIFRHLSRLLKRSTVRDAARQRGNKRRIAALWFGT